MYAPCQHHLYILYTVSLPPKQLCKLSLDKAAQTQIFKFLSGKLILKLPPQVKNKREKLCIVRNATSMELKRTQNPWKLKTVLWVQPPPKKIRWGILLSCVRENSRIRGGLGIWHGSEPFSAIHIWWSLSKLSFTYQFSQQWNGENNGT